MNIALEKLNYKAFKNANVEYKCYCGNPDNNKNHNQMKIKIIKNSQINDEMTELCEEYLTNKIGNAKFTSLPKSTIFILII